MAIARELLLNGVGVTLVDAGDLASGATSKSSRLIHGGLRYLEYGDLHLVRESLEERQRNLELAGNFVAPLELFIPVEHSWSGLISSAAGFVGLKRTSLGSWLASNTTSRGYWPVRIGLGMYDWLAGQQGLPLSRAVSLDDPQAPQINRQRYRGLLAYSDAQMRYPERVVCALLEDARTTAITRHLPFQLATYATVNRQATGEWSISSPLSAAPQNCRPTIIINASGAWGDHTLQQLGIDRPPLFGGTQGSHLVTWHAGLLAALNGRAVYAEADDGRPVFTLPFGDSVLIGTTDVRFDGDPRDATASAAEIDYLLTMVHRVFGITLSHDDVTLHYSGVRPLPRQETDSNAAVSRDHHLVWQPHAEASVLTLVGGKLTTWRALSEEVVTQVLSRLQRDRIATTTQRKLPGHDGLPDGLTPGPSLWQHWAAEFETTSEEVAALWPLFGTRASELLSAVMQEPARPIADCAFTDRVVRWVIRQEAVTVLGDLVERRLMTVFNPRLSRQHLEDLATCLVETGQLAESDRDAAVHEAARQLQHHYGRTVS
ncbi:FAD-dependent oxidoreductase [bacterium]|nr:FAD-dependent oxidoreductase [bacterium]